MFLVNDSLLMTPLFPRSGPGESGSPMSQVILRCYDFPARIPGHLLVSLPGSTLTLLGSCLAACARAPGRSEGAFRAGVNVQPATRLPACSHVDVSGTSQVSRRPSCAFASVHDPGRTDDPSPIDGFVDAAPAQTTAKASASWLYRGYCGASAPAAYASRVGLPPPMQSSLPAGWLAFAGRGLNPLDRYERFQITFSSPSPGFILAQRPKASKEGNRG